MRSLLYPQGVQIRQGTVLNAAELTADLNLDYILDACAQGDPFIRRSVRDQLLCRDLPTPETILHRQAVLQDMLAHPQPVSALYKLVSNAMLDYEEAHIRITPAHLRNAPVALKMRNTLAIYQALLDCAGALAQRLRAPDAAFASPQARDCFGDFLDFYDPAFLEEAAARLKQIGQMSANQRFTMSARMGGGLKGSDFLLRPQAQEETDRKTLRALKKNRINLYDIAVQAQAGDMRGSAVLKLLRLVNDYLNTTLRHLQALRTELAFYLGGVHLHAALRETGAPVCFPEPVPCGQAALRFRGLTDLSLALQNHACPVGNQLDFGSRRTAVVTGANQGGKSTFLRSLGIAQLMLQCGLFVSAGEFTAELRSGVFTHFCRPDSGGQRGKLDGELRQMRRLVELMDRQALVLMNESFSSTSEGDAVGMVTELLGSFAASGVRSVYVTHFYSIYPRISALGPEDTLFLSAQRNPDGSRPYTIAAGAPGERSFGMDIFREIFG